MPVSDLSALSQSFAALVAETQKRVVSIADAEGGRVSGIRLAYRDLSLRRTRRWATRMR